MAVDDTVERCLHQFASAEYVGIGRDCSKCTYDKYNKECPDYKGITLVIYDVVDITEGQQ